MNNPIIAFIGAGNMASSLIGGLIRNNYDPTKLWASDLDSTKLECLKEAYRIATCTDNKQLVEQADILVFAVKPQSLKKVATSLASTVQVRKPLVITIAAGISMRSLDAWLGGQVTIVRAMPNIPALVGYGATGLCANSSTTQAQKKAAEDILQTSGITRWFTAESQLDIVTALSGSGPAYFFLVMQALENSAIRCGLDTEAARLLTRQTALGAAQMACNSQLDLVELQQQVTSPGGTTEQAIKILEAGQIQALFHQALSGAHQRAIELADQLGNQD